MVSQDFSACYRTEKLKVVRYLINQGATEHEAHDAAQAAFLQAYRQWDTIRSPLNWLFTVARREFLSGTGTRDAHRCISGLRSRTRDTLGHRTQ